MTESWSTTPPTPPEAPPVRKSRTVAILVASAFSLIGLAMQFQPVSLLTGAGVLWIGAGLAAGGFVAAFASKVPIPLKVATALVLILCVVSVVYAERELNQQRQQIQQIFDDLPN